MSPQRRIALVSVGAAIVLIAIKLVTGLATGSLGSPLGGGPLGYRSRCRATDSLRGRRGGPPADRGHPYGHEKAEHLAALAEAGFLGLISLFIATAAVRRLVDGTAEVDATWCAFARHRRGASPSTRAGPRSSTARPGGTRAPRSPRARSTSPATWRLARRPPRALLDGPGRLPRGRLRSRRSSSPCSSSSRPAASSRQNVDVLMDQAPVTRTRPPARDRGARPGRRRSAACACAGRRGGTSPTSSSASRRARPSARATPRPTPSRRRSSAPSPAPTSSSTSSPPRAGGSGGAGPPPRHSGCPACARCTTSPCSRVDDRLEVSLHLKLPGTLHSRRRPRASPRRRAGRSTRRLPGVRRRPDPHRAAGRARGGHPVPDGALAAQVRAVRRSSARRPGSSRASCASSPPNAASSPSSRSRSAPERALAEAHARASEIEERIRRDHPGDRRRHRPHRALNDAGRRRARSN